SAPRRRSHGRRRYGSCLNWCNSCCASLTGRAFFRGLLLRPLDDLLEQVGQVGDAALEVVHRPGRERVTQQLLVTVLAIDLQQDGAVVLADEGGEIRVPVARRGADLEDDRAALTQFLDATLGLHLAGGDDADAVAEPLD